MEYIASYLIQTSLDLNESTSLIRGLCGQHYIVCRFHNRKWNECSSHHQRVKVKRCEQTLPIYRLRLHVIGGQRLVRILTAPPSLPPGGRSQLRSH